ncbi:hypothetical protein [Krasilnikovia sp. MM14-A1004]|uniref:DUF7674 family protein n=1 Tax=Krasilnikovia sp. MM14-A1004 TaxID=3373541 RepID=UPI00399C5BF7
MAWDLSFDGVVGSVVEAVPELREALAEHVRDNDEVLQHVFFGCDLVPFVVAAWKQGDTELVGRCLEVLEAAMASPDPRTRELVSVSFVEQVGPWDPDVKPFVATWPAALAAEAALYG